MPTFREQIKTYVDEHWMVPCHDGIVWVYYAGINTDEKVRQQKNTTKKDWVAAFLKYPDPTWGSLEGLYLIPATDLSKLKSGQFDATAYAERKMISSWFDKADKNNTNSEVSTQKPEYHGLNDCAHFVTKSLGAGGIHVETTGVPTLFNSLIHGAWPTKALAKMVEASAAENIINSGIMKAGDVIIYSKGSEHHHSVVYMGSGQISMHTWANHPTHPTLHGDWKASATSDHPLVTLIHFSQDDPVIPANSKMFGWWKVLWRGQNWFYHFDKTGRVGWTKVAPANLSRAPNSPTGYWFESPLRTSICWSETGSFEVLAVRPPLADTHMEGTWNGVEPLVADKM